MKTFLRFLALSLAAPAAFAVPTLQLDIGSTTTFYDNGTESIVTVSDTFTLRALGVKSDVDSLSNKNYHISIPLTPKQTDSSTIPDFGSFVVGGVTVDKNSGHMVYGVPPLDDADPGHDPGDLSKHDVFETWYMEIDFQFGSTTVGSYNSQDDPGLDPLPGGSDLYLYTVAFDVSQLADGFGLHFDLYNTKIKDGGDIDRRWFAPYSHDAEHNNIFPPPPPNTGVPEPAGALLLLTALGLLRRRHG